MNDATALVDLAAARLGGTVLAANDEFFAPKESLVLDAEPVSVPGKYTDHGKWMDGWETRRRRSPGNDWALLRLGLPGVIYQVAVDTTHFKGNFPESCAVMGCAAPLDAPVGRLLDATYPWHEVLPRTPLAGDRRNSFAIPSRWRFTHLRLDIFPDGGVARLRAFGEPVADWRGVVGGTVDLASLERGGRVVDCSDRFFGAPEKMLLPGPAVGMFDGWETRRRRGPGHDWAVVRLAAEGEIERLEVDTSFFKGNAPGSCSVEVCISDEEVPPPVNAGWRALLPEVPLSANAQHAFTELRRSGPATHVRLSIYPDGGVARLRVLGTPTQRGRRDVAVRWLDTLPPRNAESALRACGGARAWARGMAARRPFANWEGLMAVADQVWDGLARDDWIEAINSHPRLGEKMSSTAAGGAESQARAWSSQEQEGTAGASDDAQARLADANRRYTERFGWTYVVCATGRTVPEMLAGFERRIGNDAETELAVAAAEQRRITRLRLAKLLGVPDGGR